MTSLSGHTKDALAVLDAPLDDLPTVDDVIQAAMAWHFDEKTGSPFWLEHARSLPFDPRRDIRTVADLRQFPDLSSQWRDRAAEELMPRGLLEAYPNLPVRVFETGGTTGRPKRMVGVRTPPTGTEWIVAALDRFGFNDLAGENWLLLGPTGPHLAAYSFPALSHHYGGICYTVDLDPRWVKRLISEARADEVERYIEHLLDQTEWLMKSQRITVLASTPPLLQAIAARPALVDLIRDNIRAVFWGGASMSKETWHLLETEVFPQATVFGFYGNTIMGPAPQRPRRPGDEYDCIFQPFHPYAHLEFVSEESGEQVGYGERGQVRFHRMDSEVFLPNTLERDTAVRVRPVDGFGGDGVAEVRPVKTFDGGEVIEGVY